MKKALFNILCLATLIVLGYYAFEHGCAKCQKPVATDSTAVDSTKVDSLVVGVFDTSKVIHVDTTKKK